MQSLGPTFEYELYHLEPLVEACCQAGDLEGANKAARMMRQHLESVPRALTLFHPRNEDENPHDLDEVWSALDTLSGGEGGVDVLLFNSLCLAAVRRLAPQHAFAYLRMASDLKLESTAIQDAYQLLIDKAREVEDTDLEKTLITMAKDQGVKIHPKQIDPPSVSDLFKSWRDAIILDKETS